MFLVNRAQIRRGDYADVKKKLENKVCGCLLNLFFDAFLIFWCTYYF